MWKEKLLDSTIVVLTEIEYVELLEMLELLAKQTSNSCYFTAPNGKFVSYMELARAEITKLTTE